MTNEVAFFIYSLFYLAAILTLFAFGRAGLLAALVMYLMLVSLFGASMINLFGFITNAANVFYAATFLAMNILLEHYGPKYAYRFVLIGFFTIGFFTLIAHSASTLILANETAASNSALQTIFTLVPRIAFASLTAYLIAHLLNIKIYCYFLKTTGRKNLWLRNIGSQIIAQILDSLIFFTIAFYGALPLNMLAEAMIIGFFLKAEITILSTPFLYLSYRLYKPNKLNGGGKPRIS